MSHEYKSGGKVLSFPRPVGVGLQTPTPKTSWFGLEYDNATIFVVFAGSFFLGLAAWLATKNPAVGFLTILGIFLCVCAVMRAINRPAESSN